MQNKAKFIPVKLGNLFSPKHRTHPKKTKRTQRSSRVPTEGGSACGQAISLESNSNPDDSRDSSKNETNPNLGGTFKRQLVGGFYETKPILLLDSWVHGFLCSWSFWTNEPIFEIEPLTITFNMEITYDIQRSNGDPKNEPKSNPKLNTATPKKRNEPKIERPVPAEGGPVRHSLGDGGSEIRHTNGGQTQS